MEDNKKKQSDLNFATFPRNVTANWFEKNDLLGHGNARVMTMV